MTWDEDDMGWFGMGWGWDGIGGFTKSYSSQRGNEMQQFVFPEEKLVRRKERRWLTTSAGNRYLASRKQA